MARRTQPGWRHQAGTSLVELMVSLTIGLIILSAMGFVYLASSNVFRLIEANARIQENVRFAFEQITRDVRMAGYTGCGFSQSINVLNGASNWQFSLFAAPLMGHVAGAPPTGVTNVHAGDMLSVLQADNSMNFMVNKYNNAAAQFDLTATHDIKPGAILVATDCEKASVFQMTGPTNTNNNAQNVVHNTGTANPGNSTKNLGFTNCGTGTEPACKIRLLRMNAATYFLRLNPQGEPALYRELLGVASGNAVTTATEVVDGIENMQLRYGVDTSTVADGTVDEYTTADQVPVVGPEASAEDDWARVLAVRISLVAVSKANQAVNLEPQPYVLNGVTVTPTDRRLRKVFTTTIAVRNRL